MKRKIVIVGGVATGASAAARLRRLSEEDEIILVEKDEYISFANCGLPYYLGNVIEERDALIVQTKEAMKERFNIDVRNNTEATKINRKEKSVVLFDKVNNKEYEENYDYLILSPGASPVVIPIEGIENAKNVRTLRNIPDTDAIKADLDTNKVKKAVVLGGGFIGIEMAENLRHIGVEVTLLDLAPQVMIPFDDEMAKFVQNTMINYGVDIKLETSISKIEEEGKKLTLTNGEVIETDLIIMAVGVRPSSGLAKEAGLDLGERGHIIVNEYNITSDPSIYAGGDATLVKHFISKADVGIALAWPANRQGRLIADHINGIETKYNGSLGSSVVKIFDFVAASTGLNERDAKRLGYDVSAVHVVRGNHAGYYPNASNITLKVIFDNKTNKVLGAQAFGQEGTEKRIDIIATAIKFNALISDLSDIQACYAPPFSSAKDPVNIAGYAAENILKGDYIPFYVQDIKDLAADAQMIDVRTEDEYQLGSIKNTKNIPLDDLRNRLDEVDFNKDLYINCQVGHRAYIAIRILRNNGFSKNIYNLSGGYGLYKEYTEKK